MTDDMMRELADLQQEVRRSLPAYAAPRDLLQVRRLPRLSSGKPDRKAIRALVRRTTPDNRTSG